MVTVALLEPVLQERAAVASSLIRRIHADHRQVPVRVFGMVGRHLLEDSEEIAVGGWGNRALHDLAQSFFIGMHVGRKPERRAGVVVGAVGSIVQEPSTPGRLA